MYFNDALYGEIDLDIPGNLLKCPELQRLREVRLCNINSPFITGGTSLNRFEHAIGTSYLAQQIIKSNSEIQDNDKMAFLYASLLHDIVTASFGHSLEYMFESKKKTVYEHANLWRMILSGETIPDSRPVFCGKKKTLPSLFDQQSHETIRAILDSEHPLSNLLINEIDIDNIDNVFRFAFHIGITFDRRIPLKLAKSLNYENGKLSVSSESVEYFTLWFEIRKKLYKLLLENEGEFVAKSLLERCFIEVMKDDLISEYDWLFTDAEMVHYIMEKGNKVARESLQRLMLMDFPQFKEIYYVKDYERVDSLLSSRKFKILDEAFDKGVLLHFIRDVNKTNRTLKLHLKDSLSGDDVLIGDRSDRYIIGLFSDKPNALKVIKLILSRELNLDMINLRDKNANETQLSLF